MVEKISKNSLVGGGRQQLGTKEEEPKSKNWINESFGHSKVCHHYAISIEHILDLLTVQNSQGRS